MLNKKSLLAVAASLFSLTLAAAQASVVTDTETSDTAAAEPAVEAAAEAAPAAGAGVEAASEAAAEPDHRLTRAPHA